ncbi:hypothetical protein ACKWTF_002827 [Chironomus riparius]
MSSLKGNYGFNIRKTKHQFFNNLNEKYTSLMLQKCMLQNTSQHCRLNEIYYVSIIRRTAEHFLCSFLQTIVCSFTILLFSSYLLFFVLTSHTILNLQIVLLAMT